MNFEIFEHQRREVEILHPVALDLAKVPQRVREIVLGDDLANLEPCGPEEIVLVQSCDKGVHRLLVGIALPQSEAV